ncbi:hypothetical protein CIHG_06914 [Coccidioides immitis H538.4]|uniref:Uncharacterized protein n=3 Tax=Coccidioides immitis TaxID=5501 RepID=A0A0J8R2J5_COCIT|nr:hypothetical protein CISG_07210 [Coccidioides immitis RMSCC 3703]KMU89244.1 hypothetical protein CIHG_06914 [Coccidioides immitis H538.4]
MTGIHVHNSVGLSGGSSVTSLQPYVPARSLTIIFLRALTYFLAMVMDAEQPKAGGATPAAETGIAQKLSHGLERVQPLGAPTSQETPRDTARMMLREIQSPRQDPLDMDELPIYRHAVLTMGTASAYG